MDPTVNLYDELPSFANAENKAKHAEILKKNQELATITAECADLKERLTVINEHLRNVQLDLATTQQIVTAKEEEVKTEKHLQQLALREKGKLATEIAKIDEKTQEVVSKNSQIEARTFKSQQRIEAFKEEARINQEELEQWVQAARDKEEDFLVIQRYSKDDAGRVKAMLLEIEKATAIVEAKKAELEQEITTTRSLQIELDTTAEQFRKLHEERARLLSQWEQTLQKMQSLNEQIQDTTQAFESRKGEVTKYQELVAEGKKNLEMAEAENRRYERQLTISDNQVSQKHKQHEAETRDLGEFEETVETQRHKLDKLESDARAYKEEIDELRRKTQMEYDKKEEFKKRLAETENALATQKDSTKELNEQTNIMNEFLKKEEEQLKSLERAIEGEKGHIFKLSQEVFKARKHEKNLLAEIQGSQSRAKNLQARIQEFDRETQKQMELLYNSNFQIQQMERKISRIEGDGTEEEKVELQAQIEQLSQLLEGKLVTEKMLAQQLHRLELDLRQTKRRKETLEQQKTDLDTKLTELNLDQDSLDKSTAKARSQKESVLVQINMLRLQVEKLTLQVDTKCDELISLENRRQQLQLSMQERVAEIDAHLAALRTQLKTEEEARHSAVIEVQDRRKREAVLAKKYETIMRMYQVDGEEVSQSYHVIRFAQEREEVNRRGDELEEQVKTAIRELRALERAMEKLNGQNHNFRSNFTALGDGDHDIERKKTLEEQKRVAQQRLNARKAEAHAAAEEKQAMEQTYQQRNQQIEALKSELARLEPSVQKLTAENNELKDKIKRATLACNRAKETHRKNDGIAMDAPYPSSFFEMDVELKMEQAMLDSIVQELAQIAATNREVEPKLNLGLTQIGLKVKQPASSIQTRVRPPATATPTSSRSGSSVRSAASSHSTRSTASTASRGSKVSVTRIQLGGDMLSDAGSVRSAHSSQSDRSTGSVRSNLSAASSHSNRSATGTGRRGVRNVTPRKGPQITQPQVGRP